MRAAIGRRADDRLPDPRQDQANDEFLNRRFLDPPGDTANNDIRSGHDIDPVRRKSKSQPVALCPAPRQARLGKSLRAIRAQRRRKLHGLVAAAIRCCACASIGSPNPRARPRRSQMLRCSSLSFLGLSGPQAPAGFASSGNVVIRESVSSRRSRSRLA